MGTPFMRGPVCWSWKIYGVYYEPRAGGSVFCCAAFLGHCALLYCRRGPLYRAIQGAMDKQQTLQEDFAAVRAIKAYVREDVSERFERS